MGAARRDDRGGMGGPDVWAPSSSPAAQPLSNPIVSDSAGARNPRSSLSYRNREVISAPVATAIGNVKSLVARRAVRYAVSEVARRLPGGRHSGPLPGVGIRPAAVEAVWAKRGGAMVASHHNDKHNS